MRGRERVGDPPRPPFSPSSLLAATLLPYRFALYRARGSHLYMADFCYWANGLTLWHLWAAPRSLALRRAVFALASGPLALSVPAFRNALVFHSLDKSTSLFIHVGPALVAWSLRWHPGPLPGAPPTLATAAAERGLQACAAAAAATGWGGLARACAPARGHPALPRGWDAATPGDLVAAAALPYACWALAYYVLMFNPLAWRAIRRNGYETMWTYMVEKNAASPLARLVSAAPSPGYGPVIYMLAHLAATVASLCLASVWWRSQVAHSLFIVALISASAYNGATYYLDYLLRVAVRESARDGGKA